MKNMQYEKSKTTYFCWNVYYVPNSFFPLCLVLGEELGGRLGVQCGGVYMKEMGIRYKYVT